jgi:hypothetical protein
VHEALAQQNARLAELATIYELRARRTADFARISPFNSR